MSKDTKETMAEWLKTAGCPACLEVGTVGLDEWVNYSAPLQWHCNCSACGKRLLAGFKDLTETEIEIWRNF